MWNEQRSWIALLQRTVWLIPRPQSGTVPRHGWVINAHYGETCEVRGERQKPHQPGEEGCHHLVTPEMV